MTPTGGGGVGSPEDPTDPVVVHSRREATVIGVVWLVAATFCTVVSAALGYQTRERPLGPADIRPIAGIPSWVVWGYLVPWVVCGFFAIGFALWFMADDDLGGDDDG